MTLPWAFEFLGWLTLFVVGAVALWAIAWTAIWGWSG